MENFEEEGFVHSDGPGTPRNRVYQEPSAAQETQARSRRYCLYHLILYGGVVVFLAAVNLIFYEFHNAPLQNPYPATTNSVKKTVMTSSLSVSPNVESQALSTKQAMGRRFPIYKIISKDGSTSLPILLRKQQKKRSLLVVNTQLILLMGSLQLVGINVAGSKDDIRCSNFLQGVVVKLLSIHHCKMLFNAAVRCFQSSLTVSYVEFVLLLLKPEQQGFHTLIVLINFKHARIASPLHHKYHIWGSKYSLFHPLHALYLHSLNIDQGEVHFYIIWQDIIKKVNLNLLLLIRFIGESFHSLFSMNLRSTRVLVTDKYVCDHFCIADTYLVDCGYILKFIKINIAQNQRMGYTIGFKEKYFPCRPNNFSVDDSFQADV